MPEEPLKENRDELNQLAKRYLKRVKQKPEPKQLYALQLAKWGLESGNLECQNEELQHNLNGLLEDWEPKKAQNFLLVNDSGDPENLLKQLDEKKPLNLALLVLNQLDSRLSAHLSGYPKPRDLPANLR